MTLSATAVLQVGMETHYENSRQVKRTLRNMPDAKLERTYAECLREVKRGGPTDGDQPRSDFLRSLLETEIDRRILEGPRWDEELCAYLRIEGP